MLDKYLRERVISMKIRFVLERSNFIEANDSSFDWEKDYIIIREEIFSIDIKELADEEINQVEFDYYEKANFFFPRNGIERVVKEGEQYLNLLIIDYPLNEQWEEDQKLMDLIDYLTKKYESLRVNESNTDNHLRDIELNNIAEIDSIGGGLEKEEIEYFYDLLIREGFEFDIIYEEFSVYHLGADAGGIKIILNFLGHAANVISINEFLNKYFPHTKDRMKLHDIEMIKKDISEKYKVYEDQLTLESHQYNETDDQMEYVFLTRYDRFLVDVRNGEIINSSRNKID